ncbi:hypothetical protein K2173_016467 [Erythroxylum novogranatense]|uniref:Transcription factor Iwr1 domain-containing protein n=1 Tax=Erythroxylum novogranatense TaxID=1862640 RepID=A0AAV8SGB1_9ROSI|nr:hypothetical protein K2173_016467 [Erythroxylum novogranatense]
MATAGESSLSEKPVIVRVKRKSNHSAIDAFWLEINERPLKRPLLDFEKLSISGGGGGSGLGKEELKTRKVFVRHVETVGSSDATLDVIRSFVSKSADSVEGNPKSDERKRTFKKIDKHGELLIKAKQNQELFAKNARFEQIWSRRKGNRQALGDEALRDMCHFYDVVRVDVEEKLKEQHKHEAISLEDQRILCSYLPLLREFIPSAAEEIESDMHTYLSEQDDYVYDYYTVKDGMDICDQEASSPFPLVQVEDEDFYDGLDDESEFDSEDSNVEAHPRNEYPDETSDEEEEVGSSTSSNESEERESDSCSTKSNEIEDLRHHLSLAVDPLYDDEIDDYVDDGGDFDYNVDGDNFNCHSEGGDDESWE